MPASSSQQVIAPSRSWLRGTLEKLPRRVPAGPWPIVAGIALVSGIANVVLWVLALRVFPSTSAAAILHYSASIGVDFIGESSHIVALPQVATTIFVLNAVLGAAIWATDQRSAWLLWLAVPLTHAILIGAFVLLYYINL